VIVETLKEPDDLETLFEFSVFVIHFINNFKEKPKKDGTHRMILNLKNFNEYVQYHHLRWTH